MFVRNYPAKILLLGEYTIINGSKALAIPYNNLFGRWSFENVDSDQAISSRDSLKCFMNHNPDQCLSLDRLSKDLANGMWFDSSIPEGYGLGSSGALIAALFDTYGSANEDIIKNKKRLARLEDHFHGSSSGIDPLVSLVNKPLLIHSSEFVEPKDEAPNLKDFFLLNTGSARNTGPLVKIYQEKLKDPQFKKSCAEILSREVNFAIDAIFQKNDTHLFHHLWLISKFQLDFFSEMIPSSVKSFWSNGLDSGEYILKLCGAGGGGFLLGYSNKLSFSEKSEIFTNYEFRELT